MTYIVYADIMFFRNVIINLAILYVSNKLLDHGLTLVKILLYSNILGLASVMVEIFTLNLNIYIHHILYALTYSIMYCLIFKCKNLIQFVSTYAAIFMATLLIYGLFSLKPISKSNICHIVLCLCGLYAICKIIGINKTKSARSQNTYNIRISYNGCEIETIGYMDTGNCLTDYTGKPVIIIDYRLMNTFLQEEAYYYVKQYHYSGLFEYEKMKKFVREGFYPLAYHTLSSKASIIPVFKLNKLTYTDNNRTYSNVAVGISRFKLTNKLNYGILLNESLKPY
ncbi:MAG: sigma-E processing peptidase SpoIIGA [Wujia sp.]